MNFEISTARQHDALSRLYETGSYAPRSWRDLSDYSFIGVSLVERSIALLSSQLSGKLLDVGCGNKPYQSYFQHVTSYEGCDFDASRGPVDFQCPADQIPRPDNSYDSILCTEVLEHVPDPAAVWREFYRILKPGGMVLLTTPMYWPSHEQPYDFSRFPAHGLVYLAERGEFEVLDLIPRGGVWAHLGQVVLHMMQQYFRLSVQRRLWNRGVLALDRWRLNPAITIGWTILARKRTPDLSPRD